MNVLKMMLGENSKESMDDQCGQVRRDRSLPAQRWERRKEGVSYIVITW